MHTVSSDSGTSRPISLAHIRAWLGLRIRAGNVPQSHQRRSHDLRIRAFRIDCVSRVKVLRSTCYHAETAALEILSSSQHLAQDVRQLIYEVRQLLDYFRAYALKEDAIRDMFESIAERLERLERNEILLLTENNPEKRTRAAEELEQELASKRELKRRYRNLNKLQEQAAGYGELDVPLKVRNAMEAEQEKIAELESKLK